MPGQANEHQKPSGQIRAFVADLLIDFLHGHLPRDISLHLKVL